MRKLSIKWKEQNFRNICGQLAVSIIANCGLEKIFELIGTGRTSTKDLAKALRKLGFKCDSKLKRMKTRPFLAIAKLTYPNKHHWHWVVIYRDKIFDGIYGDKFGNVGWHESWKITSYLPIDI